MNLSFSKISDFESGILYRLLADSYSFDSHYQERFEKDWADFDHFFFDHTEIADKYGFITVLNNEPIGHISWDPRNFPDYVEIGHNCIVSAHKGNGYGKRQLEEAIRRIRQYEGLRKIIVETNRNLIASHNYESAGFKLRQIRTNTDDTFSGDFLDYEMHLMSDSHHSA